MKKSRWLIRLLARLTFMPCVIFGQNYAGTIFNPNLQGLNPLQNILPHSSRIGGRFTETSEQYQNLQFISQTGGATSALAVSGKYVFAGNGLKFIVLDATHPTTLEYMSSIEMGVLLADIKVSGSIAYVVGNDSSLSLIDVSNPLQPILKGKYKTTKSAIEVQVVDKIAYLIGGMGLNILDVQNPEAPKLVGSFLTTTGFTEIFITGKYAYLIYRYGSRALVIVDVSNPQQPIQAASYVSYMQPSQVMVNGNYAYLYESSSYLDMHIKTLDVSNLSHIDSVDVMATGQVNDMMLAGTRLYAAAGVHGVAVIDVTNAGHPVVVSELPLSSSAHCIDLLGHYAYVGISHNNIRIVDCSNSASLKEVGALENVIPYANGIKVVDGKAYVAGIEYGLLILDVCNPDAIRRLGQYFTPLSYTNRLAISGSLVYLADYSFGLRIIDVRTPDNPIQAGSLYLNTGALDVCINGTYAYLASGSAGLTIVNIANPSQPKKMGTLKTVGLARGIDIKGQYIYIANQEGGLRIVDVTNPNQPFEVGVSSGLTAVYDVKVSGNYAYIAEGSKGFCVIDVSAPSQPKTVATIAFTEPGFNTPMCMSLNGSTGFVGGWNGVRAFDISDPLHPLLTSIFYQPAAPCMDLAIVESTIYSAYSNYGLVILRQVSKPVASVLLVNNTQDSGPGSLRQAMLDANTHVGADSIHFAIPKSDNGFNASIGTWTIRPAEALPVITDSNTVIDGRTQARYFAEDTNADGPEIEIDNSLLVYDDCLVTLASGSEFYGLVINRCNKSGILFYSVDGGRVSDCYIGTDPKGQSAAANGSGIWIFLKSKHVKIIAGEILKFANLISGNIDHNILISQSSEYNQVAGNIIGLDRLGKVKLGKNNLGAAIQYNSRYNKIFNNVISGNQYGVYMSNSSQNEISANYIGTDSSWQVHVGNAKDGIYLIGESQHNIISHNIIGYNSENGINIIGAQALYNRLTKNRISQNSLAGINELYHGNSEITAPTILAAWPTIVRGSTDANQEVEVYADEGSQGKTYLGTAFANAAGNFSLSLSSPPPYPYLTAITFDALGNTSKFSAAVATEIIDQNESGLPRDFHLSPNFPNPFNTTTVIRYELPKQCHVRLRILNLLGKEITILVDKEQPAGYYEWSWNGCDRNGLAVSSGICLCQIEADRFMATRKMLLLK